MTCNLVVYINCIGRHNYVVSTGGIYLQQLPKVDTASTKVSIGGIYFLAKR
jgi:hypothetical protein